MSRMYWSRNEWLSLSNACKNLAADKNNSEKSLSEIVKTAQNQTIAEDRHRAISFLLNSPVFKREVLPMFSAELSSAIIKTSNTRWSRKELLLLAKAYLEELSLNPMLNKFSVVQNAMDKVLPVDRHRGSHGAWYSLANSGFLVQPNQAKTTPVEPKRMIVEPPPVPHAPKPVDSIAYIEGMLTRLLQPLHDEIRKINKRIDSIGLASEVGEDKTIAKTLLRIENRLDEIGPDEDWEDSIEESVQRIASKIDVVEKTVLGLEKLKGQVPKVSADESEHVGNRLTGLQRHAATQNVDDEDDEDEDDDEYWENAEVCLNSSAIPKLSRNQRLSTRSTRR